MRGLSYLLLCGCFLQCEAEGPTTQIVRAPFGGTVETVLVRTGDRVESGQVLVRLRSTEFEERMQRVLTSLEHVPPDVVSRMANLVGRIPPNTWKELRNTDPQLIAAEQEYVDAL